MSRKEDGLAMACDHLKGKGFHAACETHERSRNGGVLTPTERPRGSTVQVSWGARCPGARCPGLPSATT